MTAITVAQIARALGAEVAEGTVRTISGGQGRAAFVTAEDGQELVVKWSADPRWGDWLPHAVASTERLRERGYPTFRTVAWGEVEGLGAAWVQERLAGTPIVGVPTPPVLDAVLGSVALQADADAGIVHHASVDWVRSVVHDDAAGWWRAARATSPVSAAACDELAAWLGAVGPPEPRTDWTHLDLNFGNLLVQDGALSGIVDTDHLGFGDRTVDLATLAFEYERAAFAGGVTADAEVVGRLRDVAKGISGEAGWRLAVAYCTVSSLGWVGSGGMRVPEPMAVTVARRFIGAPEG